jgi:NDP-sugar pyrophosphorylase family protein
MYVVSPEVIDEIPGGAYFDIKEQLIPRLRGRHLRVCSSRYRGRHRRIVDAHTYSAFLQEMLSGAFGQDRFDGLAEVLPQVWVAEDASVDSSATLIGPVAIGSRAFVGKEAVVAGPTLVGEGATIGDKAFVSQSILWPGSEVGLGATVERAILTDAFRVPESGRVARCVAVDRALSLGDVHGLRVGGFEVLPQDRAKKAMRAGGSITSTLARLWRSVMMMRYGGEFPLPAKSDERQTEASQPRT